MKKIISFLFLISLVILTSCKDDGTVEIVSVNTFGSKVCRNDKVKVFVSVHTSDVQEASYEWSCSGGEMINVPGLFENVWQAPDEPGVYEISVTVKCDGGKDTRKTNITVTEEYFFRDYGATYSNEGMTTENMTPTEQANFPSDGFLKLTATSKDKDCRYFRNFNDSELFPPFSWQMKYWPFTVKAGDVISFRINFARPAGVTKYISRVEFQTKPVAGVWSSSYSFYDVAEGGSSTTEITAETTVANPNLIGGKGDKDVLKWRHMSFSVDAALNLIVYVEGEQLMKSSILKDLETTEGYKFNISSAEIQMSNAVVGRFDDFTVFDNGTIMTGQARTR